MAGLFPTETARLLLEYMKAGRDLSKRVTLRFDHHFDDRDAAGRMAARVQGDVVATFVAEGEEGGWVVTCLVRAVPTSEAVEGLEARLGAVAERLGGVSDGWQILPL